MVCGVVNDYEGKAGYVLECMTMKLSFLQLNPNTRYIFLQLANIVKDRAWNTLGIHG